MSEDKLSLSAILRIIDEILALEKKMRVAIESESDARRRKALLKACKDRDLTKVKELLYGIE